MIPPARLCRRLRRDRRGATVIEFAILLPVLVMLLMGLIDISYQGYVQAVLEGAVQKAGRDSTIEAADTNAIDNEVAAAVKRVAGSAQITTTRKSYSSFALIKPEIFSDDNHNGIHDRGECFTDINENGIWDSDPGRTGQGGASDVTIYEVKVTYPRLFPIAGLIGWPATVALSTQTRFKNQPFARQAVITPQVICR